MEPRYLKFLRYEKPRGRGCLQGVNDSGTRCNHPQGPRWPKRRTIAKYSNPRVFFTFYEFQIACLEQLFGFPSFNIGPNVILITYRSLMGQYNGGGLTNSLLFSNGHRMISGQNSAADFGTHTHTRGAQIRPKMAPTQTTLMNLTKRPKQLEDKLGCVHVMDLCRK